MHKCPYVNKSYPVFEISYLAKILRKRAKEGQGGGKKKKKQTTLSIHVKIYRYLDKTSGGYCKRTRAFQKQSQDSSSSALKALTTGDVFAPSLHQMTDKYFNILTIF